MCDLLDSSSTHVSRGRDMGDMIDDELGLCESVEYSCFVHKLIHYRYQVPGVLYVQPLPMYDG